MVAIPLYRGNLHRAPDLPRRWLMPNPKISLKDFRSLLARRSKALSRLGAAAPTTTSSNPNPCSLSTELNDSPKANAPSLGIESQLVKVSTHGEAKDQVHKETELVGSSMKNLVDGSDSFIDSKAGASDKASEPVDGGVASSLEKQIEPILNAEEELKRPNSMQGTAMGPSVPIQTDGTNDTGSMTRHMAPRLGSEAILVGNVEVGEADDLSNFNMHSLHMLQTSSMSPSS